MNSLNWCKFLLHFCDFEFVLGKRSIGSDHVGVNCRIDLGSFALFLHERSRLSTYMTCKSVRCSNHPARGVLILPLACEFEVWWSTVGSARVRAWCVLGIECFLLGSNCSILLKVPVSQLHIPRKCANLFCYRGRSSCRNLSLEFDLPFFWPYATGQLIIVSLTPLAWKIIQSTPLELRFYEAVYCHRSCSFIILASLGLPMWAIMHSWMPRKGASDEW